MVKIKKWSRHRSILYAAIFLLIFGIIFGGGPSIPGILISTIFFAALILFAFAFSLGGIKELRIVKPPIFGLILIIFVVPIVQVVPLPPQAWASLPGQQLEIDIRLLLNGASNWFPISVDPVATLFTVFMVVPAVAIFISVLVMREGEIDFLLYAILLCLSVSLTIGLVQFSDGKQILDFYSSAHYDYFIGLFANRNHHALFIVLCFLITCGLIEKFCVKQKAGFYIAIMALFSLMMIVITASRSGLLLMTLAALIAIDRFIILKSTIRISVIIFTGALTGLMIYISSNTQNVFGRFFYRLVNFSDDRRSSFFEKSVEIFVNYFPFGSGLGTFVPVFKKYEELNDLSPAYANHVHNDYLELLLETGIFGFIILGMMAWTAFRCLQTLALIKHDRSQSLVYFSGIGIFMVLLHSIVDYPLRTQALAIVFAAMAGIVMRSPTMKVSK